MKVILLCLALIAAAAAQTCTTWSEQEYDMDKASLNEDNGTPRGFLKAVIPNPETAKATDYPCITVNADNVIQYMEVLIETQNLGSSKICVEVDNNEDTRTCGNGQASFCAKIPSASARVEFNCDTGCDIGEVAIYYRANLSRSDIDDEYWCSERIQDYPSGLLSFVPPSDITPQTQFTDSALGLHYFSMTLLVTVCLLALAVIVRV